MRLERGAFREFYAPGGERAAILEERERWLRSDPSRYLAVLPEGEALVREAAARAYAEGTVPEAIGTAPEMAFWLGRHWEVDYLVLACDRGEPRMVAGCVCFPSSWALEEKIGLGISAIHGVVPTLNATIGPAIGNFLSRIKDGVCWTRSNWGLSRSAERNQHPSRKLPRLDASVGLEDVWFRVEEQALSALPVNNGVLFGIRVLSWPLGAMFGTPAAAHLIAALESMPAEVARYKGLETSRDRIIQLIRQR
jgi:hypothetical protein